MSGLKIYGVRGSRAIRSIWMAEELKQEIGLDYENVPTHFIEESKKPEYLAVNPNGRVPALDDDGLILFESLAINLYLAKKHTQSALSPRDLTEDALSTQWSIWALTELEENLIALVIRHPNVAMFPPDEAIETEAREKLVRPLAVLEQHLSGRDWIVSDHFMVADLNVSGVMSFIPMIGFDMSAYPNIQNWLGRCLARPALADARNG